MLKLSIIIPMYNVGPYVERCLRSLATQDIPLDDYEIICVNDGSPDNCAEVVESLQKEISNVILINQKNQGVSMARNNALAVAKGKYMMPIDPDDYVVTNRLKSLLEKVERDDLDVLYAAFEIFDANNQTVWRTDYSRLVAQTDNGYEGYFAVRGPKVKDPDRSVAILYRLDLLRQYRIDYPKGVPYLEDGLFLGKVFSVAKRVGYSDEDFYQRTTRPGSATHSDLFISQRAVRGFKIAITDWINFTTNISKAFGERSQMQLYNHILAKFIFLGFNSLKRANDFTSFKIFNEFLKKINLGKLEKDGVKGFSRKVIPWYNFSCVILYFILPVRHFLFKKYNI